MGYLLHTPQADVFHKPNLCKACLSLVGRGNHYIHFNTTSWVGGGLTCLPVLHVAAQGLWVSLQGLDNINDISVTKGRKHMVSFLAVVRLGEEGSAECLMAEG